MTSTIPAADARYSEREAVLPGFEPKLAEHEDGDQGRGRHDEAVDQGRIEEQRAQCRVSQYVTPPFEQVVADSRPQYTGSLRKRLAPVDRADPHRRE